MNNDLMFSSKTPEWETPQYLFDELDRQFHYKTVCLLPARTDTRWFHDFIYNKQNVEIRFIKGRLKFGDSKNSAPFPSMICVFNKFV